MRIKTNKDIIAFYNIDYVTKFLKGYKKQYKRIGNLLFYFDLDKTDIVADFGCGLGVLLDFIHDKIDYYYGIDFCKEFIIRAKERVKKMEIRNASFECDDIREFCKRNKMKFNKAFTLDFSEHICDEDFIPIYTHIFDSLKTGGKLYLHTPNSIYFLEILKRKGFLKQFPEHVAVRDAEKYRILLTKAGFKKINVQYVPHYIKPISYFHCLSYLPFIGKYFKARILITCSK
ncbi:MAG: class I SAM-dependent methyltransferase [candidate division WOR-3 bacterium]